MKSDEFRRLRRDFDLIEKTGNLNINHGSKLLHKFNQAFIVDAYYIIGFTLAVSNGVRWVL